MILTNPRYTGRQVWNRQRKDEVLIDVADVALGNVTKMRWNDASQWIWSDEITHPPVIATAPFQQARDILAARGHGPCQHKPHDRPRSYAFVGSLYCGVCQRRMQGQWINAAPYYRCRFPAEYALANKVSHPRNVYLRQDAFDAQVNTWLATAFAPARLSNTIDQIMAGQQVHADRTEAELRRATPTAALSREQVQAVIEQRADLAKGLRDAEPADMAGAYRKLGVRLTYHPGRNLVQATASPRPANIGKWLVSEGGLEPPCPFGALAPQASASAYSATRT